MGIDVNDLGGAAPEPRRPERRDTRSDRVKDAPASDFYATMDRFDIQAVSPEIEPYMKALRKTVTENLDAVTIRQVERVPNAWVFHRNDPEGIAVVYCIYFIGSSDLPSPEAMPVSGRFESLRKRVKEMFGERRNNIIQMVPVLASYAPDMERSEQMARSIVSCLRAETDPVLRQVKITDLGGPVFEVDYSEDRVRAAVRRFSPHGVMPRIDTGLSITAKARRDDNRRNRDDEDDEDFDFIRDNSFVSIGGFMEVGNFIRDQDNRETGGKYELRYNITAIQTRLPVLGVAAIAIGVLAPLVANDRFGLRQFRRFGKNDPNLGWVMENLDAKNELLTIDNDRDLELFYDRWFHTPDIVLNYQWGHEQIPGLWRIASGDSGKRNLNFVSLLADFLDIEDLPGGDMTMSDKWGIRIDGVYGDPNGHLKDSRYFDYFTLAEQLGVQVLDDSRREIMCTVTEDRRWTRDRQRLTAEQLPGFIPMHETVLSGLNPDFIGWVNKNARRNIDIVDKNEGRNYGKGRSMRRMSNFGDPRDMGSMVNTAETRKYSARDLLDD